MVASISRPNRSDNKFRIHMASQLVEQAAIYPTFAMLRETLDCFFRSHEMDEPRLKHPTEVIFISETIPTQSESV